MANLVTEWQHNWGRFLQSEDNINRATNKQKVEVDRGRFGKVSTEQKRRIWWCQKWRLQAKVIKTSPFKNALGLNTCAHPTARPNLILLLSCQHTSKSKYFTRSPSVTKRPPAAQRARKVHRLWQGQVKKLTSWLNFTVADGRGGGRALGSSQLRRRTSLITVSGRTKNKNHQKNKNKKNPTCSC